VHSLEGGAPKGMSPRVFPKLRRTHKYSNLPLQKQFSLYFLTSFPFRRKKIFPWEHGNMGTYKTRGAPLA